jgi:hypothetical protein
MWSETMKIRLWKLGSLEHKIFPTKEAIMVLENMLANIDGEDESDIIWDSAINVELLIIDDNEINAVCPDFVLNNKNVRKIKKIIKDLAKQ